MTPLPTEEELVKAIRVAADDVDNFVGLCEHSMAARRKLKEMLEFAIAVEQSAREARERAIQWCADFLEQIAKDDDTSEVGEEASGAFNTGAGRPMSERLRDWNHEIAESLRRLARGEGGK